MPKRWPCVVPYDAPNPRCIYTPFYTLKIYKVHAYPPPGSDTTGKSQAAGPLVDLDGVAESADLEELLGRQILGRADSPFVLQVLVGGSDGAVRGGEGGEAEDHDFESHVLGFFHGDQRGMAVLDAVEEQRPRSEILDCLPGLLLGRETFEQSNVCTEIPSNA